jgi:cell division protein FtsQ
MTVKRRLRPRLGRLAVAGLVLVGLVVGGWLWLRDSSLVAVEHVEVSGVSGPDAAPIRSALISSARNMTTLDVRVGQLRTAVAPYAVVKNLQVSTQFPHGMRIRVIEQLPVGALVAGGHAVPAAGDGTLLPDVPAGSLPAIPVSSLPGGPRVTDPAALDALAVLAAAPARLLYRISQVTAIAPHGLVAQLREGPAIYFGDTTDLVAKWTAATEVLADPGSAGASYIDVTDPARPAAGVGASAVTAAGLATYGSSGAASATQDSSGASAPSQDPVAPAQGNPAPAQETGAPAQGIATPGVQTGG